MIKLHQKKEDIDGVMVKLGEKTEKCVYLHVNIIATMMKMYCQ